MKLHHVLKKFKGRWTEFPKPGYEQIAAMNQERDPTQFQTARLGALSLLAALIPSAAYGQAPPVYRITPRESKISFHVKASVPITGTFGKWDASLVFSSQDVESGVLTVRIQAGSVSTGSGMKDRKLKGKDFFDVKNHPEITFISTKVTPLGPDRYRIDGDFTIRGVSKAETLMLTVARNTDGKSGKIEGQMAFDRQQYGMSGGIPFIKIADRVQVDLTLFAERVSGAPLTSRTKAGEDD